MVEDKKKVQTVWGIVLFLAGCGVFYRVHQLTDKIESIAGQPETALFIRICLYVMGMILVGGGLKKIYKYCFEPRQR